MAAFLIWHDALVLESHSQQFAHTTLIPFAVRPCGKFHKLRFGASLFVNNQRENQGIAYRERFIHADRERSHSVTIQYRLPAVQIDQPLIQWIRHPVGICLLRTKRLPGLMEQTRKFLQGIGIKKIRFGFRMFAGFPFRVHHVLLDVISMPHN